jgi:outer membrane receptor for ferrienterochelin and colicin
MPLVLTRFATSFCAVFVTFAFATFAPAAAQSTGTRTDGTAAASAATATIAGTLVAQDDGLAIGGASVTLYRGSNGIVTTATDSAGSYSFANEPPGLYSIVLRALGYEATRIDDVVAGAGSTTLRTVLPRARTGNASGLREIGATQTSANGSTLAASTTIQHDLSPDQLQSQGYFKAADAIGQVPGVNLTGGPHTVGDDTTIDIRGLGAGEVRPLLDGHPVGPIGVDSPDYYDYANSPYFLLSNIRVTVGSGASGLYGVDVIGGTIDFQTLNPTRTPQAEIVQGVGDQDVLTTEIRSTGSVGRLGYAVGHTVQGTTADFPPGLIFQSARPNNNLNLTNLVPGTGVGTTPLAGQCTASNDLTSCNQNLNTYSVSGNYRVQNDLGKLKYDFSNVSSLTLTAYAGNQLSDSTGNGDNDNIPYDTRLAEILTNSKPNCNGGTGYTVITNANPAACYTAQQYAAASYGPYGGGEDRNRGTSLQDYHARFQTTLGINSLTADYFRDFYNYRKNSNQAAGLDPTGTYFVGGGTYEDEYLTNGLLLGDDIALKNNDFGFGYYLEHQREYGNNFNPGNYDPTQGPLTAPAYVPQSELGSGDFSYFIRDQYFANDKLSFYLNAWQRYSNVTEKATFDPRLSIVVKPTRRDVIRLTGGRADGDPSISLKQGGLNSFGNPSSLNPSCTLLNSVASGPNPSVQPESSTDYEIAYGHAFWADTAINVVGYVSEVKNQLFTDVVPLTSFPGGTTNPQITPLLAGYATKLSGCPGVDSSIPATVIPFLGVTETANAAGSLYRGIELSGRIRGTPEFYLDYQYDVQSSQQTGIPIAALQANPVLIDNAQIEGIPVHKGSVTADYNNRNGFEAQLQGFYVGDNNTLQRPAYTFFNGFLSKTLPHNLSATVSVNNLFNQNSQIYGYFGHQLFVPLNQYAPAGITNSIQEAAVLGNQTSFEELGLAPRVTTVYLTLRL